MPAAEAKHGADYNMACYRGLPAAIPGRNCFPRISRCM